MMLWMILVFCDDDDDDHHHHHQKQKPIVNTLGRRMISFLSSLIYCHNYLLCFLHHYYRHER